MRTTSPFNWKDTDITNTVITATRKIGRNKGKSRLWIEGALLTEAGFEAGTRWTLEPLASGGFLIHRSPEGNRKVSGKPGRPIIDITGVSLGALADAAEVSLSYRPGFGLVVVVKTSHASCGRRIAGEAAA